MQISFVRRIDELGRIVIPKEIRNKLKISSGELLDLNILDDSLVIKKSSSMINLDYAKMVIDLISYFADFDLVVTQGEKIEVFTKTIDANIKNAEITEELKEIMKERKSKEFSGSLKLTDNFDLKGHIYVKTIIKDSDAIGLLIMCEKEKGIADVNVFMSMVTNMFVI